MRPGTIARRASHRPSATRPSTWRRSVFARSRGRSARRRRTTTPATCSTGRRCASSRARCSRRSRSSPWYRSSRPTGAAELSRRLLERKVGHIKSTGAELVVTANPGCLMQIQSGLRREAPAVRVVHLIDLLDEAYGAS
ncbi:MAG: (Fe-S)-binding protein [Chloroflexi bacterium]|nr:MAG: (Fe-S)-binding protein [Chloroflexota bacterium]